ncbi:RNA dependent RNA polymerase-domain-containing protein [Jimgerdemannia flammicorona]|uniref:RNA-dependent RNA polymerase n=1 Tax=Jimgerdemannia flammicorona TaxID=994334 RepID=A0A433CYM3_9FUNG|nr:RNA dependent RNA polymerase-domain-containing protein [Jimgerdemannia flammicorona]
MSFERVQKALGFPKPPATCMVVEGFTYREVMMSLSSVDPAGLVQEVDKFVRDFGVSREIPSPIVQGLFIMRLNKRLVGVFSEYLDSEHDKNINDVQTPFLNPSSIGSEASTSYQLAEPSQTLTSTDSNTQCTTVGESLGVPASQSAVMASEIPPTPSENPNQPFQPKKTRRDEPRNCVNVSAPVDENTASQRIEISNPAGTASIAGDSKETVTESWIKKMADRKQSSNNHPKPIARSSPVQIIIDGGFHLHGQLNRLPFFAQWEIARFINHGLLEWSDITPPRVLECKSSPEKTIELLLQWRKESARVNAGWLPPSDRTSDSVWDYIKTVKHPDIDSREASETPYSRIQYMAKLSILTSSKALKITLQPLAFGSSNRFFRKYGSHRFLQVKIPANMKREEQKILRDHFQGQIQFRILSYSFSFLFAKNNTIYLFATEQEGKERVLEPISVWSVIDWHIPIDINKDLRMSKFWSRMDLAFSKSVGTVTFTPDKLDDVDDVLATTITPEEKNNPPANKVMTDGCARISCAAMKEIGDMLNREKNHLTPIAVQGRINGAKGIWFLDPKGDFNSGNWIQITKSQKKFQTGVRNWDVSTYDPLHYTMDICKTAKAVCPSFLNTQIIMVLAEGGVPAGTFVEIMKASVERIMTEVWHCDDPLILRNFVAKVGYLMKERQERLEIEQELWQKPDDDFMDAENGQEDQEDQSFGIFAKNVWSGYSDLNPENCISLLDSGFKPSTCPFLASELEAVLQMALKPIFSKYRIEVPQSCTVMCMADPLKILKVGEIFLQMDPPFINERTGMATAVITGDVVVTRNPCGLLSDVQKVKAVDSPSLSMYKNVVVFPTVGNESLASLLSGGDYDGDIIFCCWDSRITSSFENSNVDYPPDDFQDKHFDKRKTTVRQELKIDDGCTSHQENEVRLQTRFFELYQEESLLGTYENWRMISAETKGFRHKDTVYLARMCSQLVDAPKQGLTLKAAVKSQDEWKFRYMAQAVPRWYAEVKNSKNNTIIDNREPQTVMGILYEALMEYVKKVKDPRFSVVENNGTAPRISDADLFNVARDAEETAAASNDKNMSEDLKNIETKIEQLTVEYEAKWAKIFQGKKRREDKQREVRFGSGVVGGPYSCRDEIASLKEEYRKRFYSEPDPLTLKSNSLKFDTKRGINPSELLDRLKASYAYMSSIKAKHRSKFCWHMALRTLCNIKAQAVGQGRSARIVVDAVYPALTVDRKWLRRNRDEAAKGLF